MNPWLTARALLAKGPRPFATGRIHRITRVVSDLDRATAFYRDAVGARPGVAQDLDPAILAALGLPNAEAIEQTLTIGAEKISLVRFATPGLPYPPTRRSDDPWFQHLAIVVADIDAAHAQLAKAGSAHPITQGGPQTLPKASGRVRAYKFRDPDGHPLEFLQFPPGQGRPLWHRPADKNTRGIDHIALAVADTARSLHFYRGLGLHVAARSQNQGPAQSRLDAIPDVQLQVTALRPRCPQGPGIELLAYANPRPTRDIAPNDTATDWSTLSMRLPQGAPLIALRDPDGHRLLLAAE